MLHAGFCRDDLLQLKIRSERSNMFKMHMALKMHLIRKALLESRGVAYKEDNYYKLPGDFSTHPSVVVVRDVMEYYDQESKTCKLKGEFKVKVLSSAEAKAASRTKATRPHRILVFCEVHKRWIFAGKYVQHAKLTHKEGKEK